MLSDQALPKYRETAPLLNELHEIVRDLEERSEKANRFLMDNKLTEAQKVTYDKMTKDLAVFKGLEQTTTKLLLNYERLVKLPVESPEWKEAHSEYLLSTKI